MKQQQTISKAVELTGRGLFTGEEITVRIRPAAPDTGVVFVRADQPEPVRIPALIDNVTKRARRSSLRNGTVSIETVEHFMAAVVGADLDNLEIELSGPGCELPGGDGSCLVFLEAFRRAGATSQDAERRVFQITQHVRVSEGDASIDAVPGDPDVLDVLYDLDYGDAGPIGRQIYAVRVMPETFEKDIAPARTFLLEAEAKAFQARGLGAHLTYKDVLVFGPEGPIDNEARFENECVRHKIQDLIGDAMLLGRHLRGRLIARKSGHSLNHRLVMRLMETLAAEEMSRRMTSEPAIDIRRIQRLLPHRYPFLMIDRVIELEPEKRITAVKNITINEEFFQGHYPGQPIMPGVMIVEAMAQATGLLLSQKLEHTGKVAVLLSIDSAKFRRAVMPGDQLILESETIRVKARTAHVRCRAKVGNALAAEATLKCMMVDAEPI
ncbi:MAG: UDP-3-O-[3-hydroxymyristoyl] N-acetylglucosamine deacetylase [Phycisphaerae bacterium]|nr:UDP-3-O-[3-hydroxymyristoyl] N-acetylglucosamine deacetylase [Phycisphaerae bacterium]